MHIIFGDEADKLREKYTVLELDTILVDGDRRTAYCVVETIPLQEIHRIEEFSNLHANLIVQYGRRNWNYCEQALEHLHGRWAGVLDTFYDDLGQRVQSYKSTDPGPDWDPVRKTN